MNSRGMTACLLAALVAGCGPSGPKLVPVSGTITLDGKPLEGAGVTFAPDPSNPVSTPGGTSSGPGGAFLAVCDQRPGLAPGKYKVLVTKTSLKNGAKIPDEFKDDPAMAVSSGLTVETLPPEYANANTSPLSLDVPEEGGTFTFDVKKNPAKPRTAAGP